MFVVKHAPLLFYPQASAGNACPRTCKRRRSLRSGAFAIPQLRWVKLLEGDGSAGLFELSLRLLGGLLVDTLEHGGRGAVDNGLRLAQSEAGQRANLLDDLDLLVTSGVEDDVEGILLLGLFGRSGGGATSGCNSNRSSSGDLEYFVKLLHELAELNERELLECLDELVA